MTSQITFKEFNKIYDNTYEDILKYIICKCHNINDANDIVQEVYFELWKILNKKELDDKSIKSYIIGIANNKIKKHFSLLQKIKTISIFSKNDDMELNDVLESKINIEKIVIDDNTWDRIWIFIKSKKNQNIPKIFYLHYKLGLTIKEISNLLNLNESYIKNLMYRTLKEIKSLFEREGDYND